MLVIKFNTGMFGQPVSKEQVKDIVRVIEDGLAAAKITRVGGYQSDFEYSFGTVNESGSLFISKSENKIRMKQGDKRIAKLGRDYLTTHKLTEDQHNKVVTALFKIFDDLEINANITLHDGDEDDGVLETEIRSGMVTRLELFPKPKSFAQGA